MMTPKRLVPVGEEISFCGLDCHLHVSVKRVSRAGDLTVLLQFRSDARAANEYPGELRFLVEDATGRRYSPSAGMIAEPLPAGATIEREFRFSLPRDSLGPRLLISSGGWLDFLVPGEANPWVKMRTALAL
jgi:hypothetical protein